MSEPILRCQFHHRVEGKLPPPARFARYINGQVYLACGSHQYETTAQPWREMKPADPHELPAEMQRDLLRQAELALKRNTIAIKDFDRRLRDEIGKTAVLRDVLDRFAAMVALLDHEELDQ